MFDDGVQSLQGRIAEVTAHMSCSTRYTSSSTSPFSYIPQKVSRIVYLVICAGVSICFQSSCRWI